MKPFEGIKVLDLTQFTAGPFSTMILSDLGADVIKFENPPVGDVNRYVTPTKNKKTVYYTGPNRGKKSVVMNLKDERQRKVFYKMVETADVVASNYKTGTLEKLGVDYETLSKINPRIVVLAISGYGQTGPWRNRAAYDRAVQAASGIMSLNGVMNGGPTTVGISIADMLGGLWGCIGMIAALYEAKMTGKGRFVDISMMDAVMATIEAPICRYLMNGEIAKPMGNRHPSAVPQGVYRTKDGVDIMIAVSSEPQFGKLCALFGNPEYASDPRFVTQKERLENREATDEMVQSCVGSMSASELCEALEKNALVFSRIQNVADVVNCEQTKARKMIANVTYPDGTVINDPACPIKFSDMEEQTEFRAADLGEHTIEILTQYEDPELIHEIFDPVIAAAKETYAERSANLR